MLTAREIEVLVRIALGESAPKIAAGLSVTISTVKTHLAHIYRKFGVSDRAAAVAQGFLLGLLSDRIISAATGIQPQFPKDHTIG